MPFNPLPCISQLLLFCLLMAGSAGTLCAQWTLSGTVRNENGEPILGAGIVRLDDISQGTLTDLNGEYRLDLPASLDSAVLRVSLVGYYNETFSVQRPTRPNSTRIKRDIRLREEAVGMGIIIIGPAWDARDQSSEMDVARRNELQTSGARVSSEQVLNAIPGVRFDSRGAGGSRRLSIRGSVLRSPFGVQNIKAYYAGAPLSSPDGSTPIEVVDLSTVESIEVKKGQLGDAYGPGNGGVIAVEPEYQLAQGKWGGQAEFSMGSYGFRRWMAGAGLRDKSKRVAIRYIGQRYAGFRAQEANQKDMVLVHADHLSKKENEDRTVNWRTWLTSWYYQGYWELPGALTETEAQANPRQALPYSETAQAAVNRKRGRLLLGFSRSTDRSMLRLTAYGNLTTKVNPYGTSAFFQGYKDEQAQGAGGRLYYHEILPISEHYRLQFRLATEFQTEGNRFVEFENAAGSPGNLRARNLIHSQQAHLYGAVRLAREYQFLELATGLNQVNYHLTDQLATPNFSTQSGFSPAVLPSLTYHYKNPHRDPHWQFRARLSTGYSPPSLAEMQRDNGALDTSIEAEKTLGLEIRPAIKIWRRRITLESNLYHFRIRQAILPQQLASGETVFRNAGQTRQSGVEAGLRYDMRDREWENPTASIFAKIAWQDYFFHDYVKDSIPLTGNRVPGVPQLTAIFGAEAQIWEQFYVTGDFRYQGRTAANDENTVFQAAYFLFNCRLAYQFNRASYGIYPDANADLAFEVFAGGQNLLNTSYTNFLNLNAFGNRYWNPAPNRNFFAGIGFRF